MSVDLCYLTTKPQQSIAKLRWTIVKCARLSLPFSWKRSFVVLPIEYRTEDPNPFLIAEELGLAIVEVVDTSNIKHADHSSCYSFSGVMVSQGVMVLS